MSLNIFNLIRAYLHPRNSSVDFTRQVGYSEMLTYVKDILDEGLAPFEVHKYLNVLSLA